MSLLQATLLCPIVVVLVLMYGPQFHPPNFGIRVAIDLPATARPPLVLRIDRKGNYWLEGHPLPSGDLKTTLIRTFRTRPDWHVCLEADPLLEYQFPARAVDLIVQAGGKPILQRSCRKERLYTR